MNQFDLIGDIYCIFPRIGMETNVSLTCCCKIWKSLKNFVLKHFVPIQVLPTQSFISRISCGYKIFFIALNLSKNAAFLWGVLSVLQESIPGFNLPQICSFVCHFQWLHIKLWHSAWNVKRLIKVCYFWNTNVISLTIYYLLCVLYH